MFTEIPSARNYNNIMKRLLLSKGKANGSSGTEIEWKVGGGNLFEKKIEAKVENYQAAKAQKEIMETYLEITVDVFPIGNPPKYIISINKKKVDEIEQNITNEMAEEVRIIKENSEWYSTRVNKENHSLEINDYINNAKQVINLFKDGTDDEKLFSLLDYCDRLNSRITLELKSDAQRARDRASLGISSNVNTTPPRGVSPSNRTVSLGASPFTSSFPFTTTINQSSTSSKPSDSPISPPANRSTPTTSTTVSKPSASSISPVFSSIGPKSSGLVPLNSPARTPTNDVVNTYVNDIIKDYSYSEEIRDALQVFNKFHAEYYKKYEKLKKSLKEFKDARGISRYKINDGLETLDKMLKQFLSDKNENLEEIKIVNKFLEQLYGLIDSDPANVETLKNKFGELKLPFTFEAIMEFRNGYEKMLEPDTYSGLEEEFRFERDRLEAYRMDNASPISNNFDQDVVEDSSLLDDMLPLRRNKEKHDQSTFLSEAQREEERIAKELEEKLAEEEEKIDVDIERKYQDEEEKQQVPVSLATAKENISTEKEADEDEEFARFMSASNGAIFSAVDEPAPLAADTDEDEEFGEFFSASNGAVSSAVDEPASSEIDEYNEINESVASVSRNGQVEEEKIDVDIERKYHDEEEKQQDDADTSVPIFERGDIASVSHRDDVRNADSKSANITLRSRTPVQPQASATKSLSEKFGSVTNSFTQQRMAQTEGEPHQVVDEFEPLIFETDDSEEVSSEKTQHLKSMVDEFRSKEEHGSETYELTSNLSDEFDAVIESYDSSEDIGEVKEDKRTKINTLSYKAHAVTQINNYEQEKNTLIVNYKKFLASVEKNGYQLFDNSEGKEIVKRIDKMNEEHNNLIKFYKNNGKKEWNAELFQKFTNKLQKANEPVRYIQNYLEKQNRDEFNIENSLMKNFLKLKTKDAKVTAGCQNYDHYHKLSEQSLKTIEDSMKGVFVNEANKKLYSGVACKKEISKPGKIHIMIPPNGAVERVYRETQKCADITIKSAGDRAIFISLDVNKEFKPLKIETPEIKPGVKATANQINQSDMDFLLKMVAASRIRGVPVVINPDYDALLKQQYEEHLVDHYDIIDKIRDMPDKEFKTLAEGKSLTELVKAIRGDTLDYTPGRIIPPKG